MTTVLTHAAADIRGSVTEAAADRPDPAAVLHDRVTRWLEDAEPVRDGARLVAGLVPAADHVTDPELARTLRDIESLITTRAHALVTGLLHRPAAWAIPLGPPPRDSNTRRGWLDALAVVAGYRDLHNITGDQPLGDAEDRQPDPSGQRRRATAAAASAARLAHTREATSTRSDSHPSPERSIQR